MGDASDYLRSEFSALELHEVLSRPVTVLLGVSPGAADALKEIGVETVFDLGASWLFANAWTAAAVDQLSTPSGRLGLAPSSLLKPAASFESLNEVPLLPLEFLSGLADPQATALKSALDVATIRDFAFWPPRLAAHKLVSDAAGTAIDPEEEQSEALRPRFGQYPTERVYYRTLAMLQMDEGAERNPLQGPISLMPAVDQPTGFGKPAVGVLLTSSQSWYARGVTLGHMLHSLALAPGEATRIAVVDWARRTSATAAEAIVESEQLDNSTLHARAISEVQNAVATELQEGGSMSSGWARSTSEAEAYAGSSGLVESLFASGSESFASQESTTRTFARSSSWSVGSRSISADMTQKVNDRTEQHANSVRNRRATAVREVSQSEHEAVSTRIVANYNHMHALTIQYYEVVQVYQVASNLHQAERCLFVPFELLDFSVENAMDIVQRFRGALVRGALTDRARDLLIDDTTMVAIKPSVRTRIPSTEIDLSEVADESITVALRADIEPGGTPEQPSSSDETAFAAVATAVHFWNRDEILKASRAIGRSTLRPGSSALYLTDDTELLAISFSGVNLASVRLDRPGVEAAGNTFTIPAGTGLVDLPPGIRLHEIDSIAVARAANDTLHSGFMTLHCNYRGRPFKTPSIPLQLAPGTAMQKIADFQPDTADRRKELLAHLQANRAHYSQVVFRSLDSATLVMLLSPFTWNDKPLVDQIEPNPLTVAGNFIVFRAPVESDEPSGVVNEGNNLTWGAVLEDRGINFATSDTRLVPIPTGGVFAEAVLGRSNAAEKLDITRFWNWQDSPIPLQPPEISPVATGSRGLPEDLTPGELGAPVLNIVNPTSLPDPAGLSASLGALATANLFRDMSGLAGTQALSQQALKETLAAASQAGQLASTNLQTEAQKAVAMGQIAADIAKAAMKIPSEDSTEGVSAEGARINHGRDMDERGVSGPDGASQKGGGSSGSVPSGGGGSSGGGESSDGSGGGGSSSRGNGGTSRGTFSREAAYADRAAFGASPDFIRATAEPIAAAFQPTSINVLSVLCDSLRQQRQQWQTVQQEMVRIAIDQFQNTWNNGNNVQNSQAMTAVITDYWQEPAYHGEAIPGHINIPGSAWSGVFIAWVVDQAGGGDRFSKVDDEANYRVAPQPPGNVAGGFRPIAHWRYLAPSILNRQMQSSVNPFWGFEIDEIRPQPGDIVIRSRNGSNATFADHHGHRTHGDIVIGVDEDAGTFTVIGGNKSGPGCPTAGCTVNRRVHPLTADGFVDPQAGLGGEAWFAIVRINLDIFHLPVCDQLQSNAGQATEA